MPLRLKEDEYDSCYHKSNKKEEKLISAGDVVFIPANEVHWYGAAADSEFSHIYNNSRKTKLTRHED
jgi:quercetin dioxygenase-like cupin family protein